MIKKQFCLPIISLIFLSTASYAGDYFLTLPQKKELILAGQMHDEQQRLYDVWIVTGYVQPAKHIKQGWQKAGESLKDYGHPMLYNDIDKYSNNTWHYGTQDILQQYTFEDSSKAWQTSMATAKKRTQQRVFGWWLAYPWGVFEASVESVLRVATGLPVGVAVAASAYTVVPVITFVWPSVESVGYATIEGTAYPLVASAWNTVIAPPLAFLGQQPAPERADGFWMKQVDDPSLQAVADVMRDWQQQLLASQTPIALSKAQIQLKNLREQVQLLEQQLQVEEAQQKQQRVEALLTQAQLQKTQLAASLASKGLSLEMVARNRQALKLKLSDLGLSYENLDKLLDVLTASAPNELERQTDDKTDPLQRSLDIMHGH
jgi:hypothetical protein